MRLMSRSAKACLLTNLEGKCQALWDFSRCKLNFFYKGRKGRGVSDEEKMNSMEIHLFGQIEEGGDGDGESQKKQASFRITGSPSKFGADGGLKKMWGKKI
jgi:hypothetical protein